MFKLYHFFLLNVQNERGSLSLKKQWGFKRHRLFYLIYLYTISNLYLYTVKTQSNGGTLVNSYLMGLYMCWYLLLTFIPPDAVVLWRADVGDADQRSEPLPRGGPLWHNTLLTEGQEASPAAVLPWSFVSSQNKSIILLALFIQFKE